MYLNAFQRYIKELIDEYGTLLKRQLLVMVNTHIGSQLPNIDGYVSQMCQFSHFDTGWIVDEEYVGYRGVEPDFDMIRSFDVMIAFLPNIKWHRRSKEFVSIRFYAGVENNEKEIGIIPVKYGMEKIVSSYASDKTGEGKCEVTLFLLEDKKQMKLIHTDCHCKFAVIGRKGVEFYTL